MFTIRSGRVWNIVAFNKETEMPKLKTKRSAAKRFTKTGSGKFMFNKEGRSHILTKKSTKRKRNLRRRAVIDDSMVKSLKRMMPYV